MSADGVCAVARGWANDPDTLEGLVGPVDPSRVLGLPWYLSPQEIALFTALVALVTMGRGGCRSRALARLCRIPHADLAYHLRRVSEAKAFHASTDGTRVTVAPAIKRLLRPDRYVRLSVEALAASPSAAHARFYALAAQASIGDAAKGTNVVRLPLKKLAFGGGADPMADLPGMAAWATALLGGPVSGRVVSAGVDGEDAVVAATNPCDFAYAHQAAPRPWVDKGRERDYGGADGAWRGHDLSVPFMRAAKVVEWCRRRGCRTPARWFRAAWLGALREALSGRDVDGVISGRRLLDLVARSGAARAFEVFALDFADRARGEAAGWRPAWLTPHVARQADEARVLRRMASVNPADPRLAVRARCPQTGEAFTAAQWRAHVWRAASALRRSGASPAEVRATLSRMESDYEPHGPPAPARAATRRLADPAALAAALAVAQALDSPEMEPAYAAAQLLALRCASGRAATLGDLADATAMAFAGGEERDRGWDEAAARWRPRGDARDLAVTAARLLLVASGEMAA